MSSKILCVDDDKDILDLLSFTLSRAGFEVATLSKPKEAVAYAARIKPDLILLDVMMPELSGYHVCVALREHPETQEVPVIFLTAVNHEHADKMKALSLGAVDFISKPFNKETLVAAIKKHLAKEKNWSAAAGVKAPLPVPAATGTITSFRDFLLAPGGPGRKNPELVKKMNNPELYKVLDELGLPAPEGARLIADFLKLPCLSMINPDDIELGVLPSKFAQGNNLVTLRDDNGGLLVAVASPFDFELMDTLRRMIREPYKLVIAEPGAISNLYAISPQESGEQGPGGGEVSEGLTIEVSSASQWGKRRDLGDEIDGSPVKYITSRIIEAAIHERASDVHLEPKDLFTAIRFRVDGDLREFTKLKKNTAIMVLTRLKAMAGMDIAERRRPQDGAFVVKLRDRKFTLRMATTSTNYGESLVMRLVEPQAKPKTLSELGMNTEQAETMLLLSSKTQGMIIIAGPTGSGKTTTIYSFLSNIDCQRRSLISVEDPIEFRITQANQQQVNERAGVTFEALLKSSVRQDPDILFLGEVRDKPSAQIALDFSSTGHLTVTTMHTSNATTAVFRMERLGVSRAQIADTVLAVISQRLIKRLCPKCKAMKPPEPGMLETFSRFGHPAPGQTGHPVGCPVCRNTGYAGREAVYEIILMTPDVSEMIRSGASISHIRETLRSGGVTLMTTSALAKVAEGAVSYQDAYQKVLAEDLGAVPLAVADDVLDPLPEGRAPEPVYVGSKKDVAALKAASASGALGKKILVVDDDPDILLLARKVIAAEGYAVTTAKDGIEAIMLLSSRKFDLVLSDIDMPELDGLRLLELLHQKNIKADVAFFTACGSEDLEERCLALGALDYIRKPVRKEILLLRLKNIFAQKK
ncbi:MAG: ATPase, T2SS/T4P/T4SS family [Elusimicrobia bacterium]|nr:ATPase, T2SS/T4P/T4SS family [Elusimicrobiota bacterium]